MKVNRFWLSTFCRNPNGQGLDRLADVVQRGPRTLAQGLFDQLLGKFQSAGPHGHARWIGPGELLNRGFLLIAGDRAELGDFDGNRFHLLGFELAHQLRGLIVRQAHEQNGGFANVLGHGGSQCLRNRKSSTEYRPKTWEELGENDE